MSRKTPRPPGRRRPPTYWWDFEGDAVIVETDDPLVPVAARFPCAHDGPACAAIALAEKRIADLESGRVHHPKPTIRLRKDWKYPK